MRLTSFEYSQCWRRRRRKGEVERLKGFFSFLIQMGEKEDSPSSFLQKNFLSTQLVMRQSLSCSTSRLSTRMLMGLRLKAPCAYGMLHALTFLLPKEASHWSRRCQKLRNKHLKGKTARKENERREKMLRVLLPLDMMDTLWMETTAYILMLP
jgi:hypothetical protein